MGQNGALFSGLSLPLQPIPANPPAQPPDSNKPRDLDPTGVLSIPLREQRRAIFRPVFRAYFAHIPDDKFEIVYASVPDEDLVRLASMKSSVLGELDSRETVALATEADSSAQGTMLAQEPGPQATGSGLTPPKNSVPSPIHPGASTISGRKSTTPATIIPEQRSDTPRSFSTTPAPEGSEVSGPVSVALRQISGTSQVFSAPEAPVPLSPEVVAPISPVLPSSASVGSSVPMDRSSSGDG